MGGPKLRKKVWSRAADACEYCRLPQAFSALRFQIDHVIAQKHHGAAEFENLALACFRCNAFKGPNIAGIDPDSSEIVRLFNPRQDVWEEHFEWSGAVLRGLSPIGRATIDVLRMNDFDVVRLRQSLIEEGAFPPPVRNP